jgi:phage-related protein
LSWNSNIKKTECRFYPANGSIQFLSGVSSLTDNSRLGVSLGACPRSIVLFGLRVSGRGKQFTQRTKIGTIGQSQSRSMPRTRSIVIVLSVCFFQTDTGNEPVRQWLRDLEPEDRKMIGEDVKTVQFGWPLGMPLVRKMGRDLWEIRITLPQRIARVLFTVVDSKMILLHGFIKKSQATPQADLDLARDRLRQLQSS